jgi:hypothetical protein
MTKPRSSVRTEVFCPNCRVLCVFVTKETKKITDREWVFQGTCWNCKEDLPTIHVILVDYDSSISTVKEEKK